MGLHEKAFAHGAVGGLMSVAQGGEFGHGFAASFITKEMGEWIKGNVDVSNKSFSIKRTIIAGITGGTVSAATGGKFANGAITNAIQWAFNAESSDEWIEELNQRVETIEWDKLSSLEIAYEYKYKIVNGKLTVHGFSYSTKGGGKLTSIPPKLEAKLIKAGLVSVDAIVETNYEGVISGKFRVEAGVDNLVAGVDTNGDIYLKAKGNLGNHNVKAQANVHSASIWTNIMKINQVVNSYFHEHFSKAAERN